MRTHKRIALGLLGLIAGGLAVAEIARAVESRRSVRDPLVASVRIDREIDKKLAEGKVPASVIADDAEFLRRLSLDLLGRVPSYEKTIAFLGDASPDKRRKLIDEFLDEPEFGQHFATIWYHRVVKPTTENRFLISKSLQDWLAERFNRNEGWDAVVREILTADGDRDKNPATVFFLNHVDNKRFAPPRAAATASHLFLGVKLECCECHDHPFDSELKQTDFWGVAAFFNSTRFENAGKKDAGEPAVRETTTPARPNKKDKEERATVAPFGSIVIPDSKGKTVKATFLHAKQPAKVSGTKLRPAFAEWVVSPTNPYFAKATVNKLWANFFGRGIVNPVDDMTANSTNTHPELLKALADEFVASGFDTKHFVRCVCNSKAYQRTSVPTAESKADEELYSHMKLKVMTADMLYDSLGTVLGHSIADRGRPGAMMKKADPKIAAKFAAKNDPREQFRDFFHAEADDDAGVIDEYTHGIPQVLRLMNAKGVNDTSAIAAKAAKAGSRDKAIDELYLRALSRHATTAEKERAAKYVAESKTPTAAYGDLLWALLNSAEFLFVH
ncbi:MAG: DUF1549 and DUF1553 domain-containing protein [Gemmataceae bacterium]